MSQQKNKQNTNEDSKREEKQVTIRHSENNKLAYSQENKNILHLMLILENIGLKPII